MRTSERNENCSIGHYFSLSANVTTNFHNSFPWGFIEKINFFAGLRFLEKRHWLYL